MIPKRLIPIFFAGTVFFIFAGLILKALTNNASHDLLANSPRVSDLYSVGESLGWHVQYDNLGRISQTSDPSGNVIHYSYTPSDSLPIESVTETTPDGAQKTWAYDASGHMVSMTDSLGTAKYVYDSDSHVIEVNRDGFPSVHYTYDAGGRMTDMQVGSDYHLTWQYDFLRRVTLFTTPAGSASYQYNSATGETIRNLSNGLLTIWKRQPNGDLDSIIHGKYVD